LFLAHGLTPVTLYVITPEALASNLKYATAPVRVRIPAAKDVAVPSAAIVGVDTAVAFEMALPTLVEA
jgi:hypothetical protein